MTALDDLLALPEAIHREVPLFPVQAPDGLKHWAERPRQTRLFKIMRDRDPAWLGFAFPNAGKRNPAHARAEGIMAGPFDTLWPRQGLCPWVEMKGYTAAGRPGTLSDEQIRWGNRMHLLGYPVACFFCPTAAADWLCSLAGAVSVAGLMREGQG